MPSQLEVVEALGRLLAPDPPAADAGHSDSFGALPWQELLTTARQAGLLPALAVALDVAPSAPEPGEAPTDADAVLSSFRAANAEVIAAVTAQLERVLAVAAEAGCTLMPLKGAHGLSQGWYPAPEARTLVDLDLLVPIEQAAAMRAALEAVGYRAEPDAPPPPDYHMEALVHPDEVVAVELHTYVLQSYGRPGLPTDAAWTRARDGRPGKQVMHDADAIAHLVLHAQVADGALVAGRLPLRPLWETATILAAGKAHAHLADIRARLAPAGRGWVLDAHMADTAWLFVVGESTDPASTLVDAAFVRAHRWRCRAELRRSPAVRVAGPALGTAIRGLAALSPAVLEARGYRGSPARQRAARLTDAVRVGGG